MPSNAFYHAVIRQRDEIENVLRYCKLQDSDAVMLELAKAKICLDKAVRIMDEGVKDEGKSRRQSTRN